MMSSVQIRVSEKTKKYIFGKMRKGESYGQTIDRLLYGVKEK